MNHSAYVVKGFWMGGWKVKCRQCGTLRGSYHLKMDAQRVAGRHRG